MKYFFSPSCKSIYPEELKAIYQKANSWPVDLVEIPASLAKGFIETSAPKGKTLGCSDGLPEWVDITPTEDSIILIEILWVKSELNVARDELEKVQDSDPKAVGSVSEWRTYRKELRSWETHEKFPDKHFRPISPTSKGI